MYVFANPSNGYMTASVFERYIYGVLKTHKYSTYTDISSGMKARSNHHHQPYLDRWIISHLEPLNIYCFFCSSDSIIYSNNVYHRYHCTHMYVFASLSNGYMTASVFERYIYGVLKIQNLAHTQTYLQV